ncbi:MAG TPA: MFS transporter [Candidatus Limnocylindria bacterium]|nr:MFS transporter [Candidatus Limnocylindria bacterium]
MTGGAWAPERRVLTAGLIGLVTAAAFEGMAVPTVMPAMVDDLGGLDLYGWAFSSFWLTNIIGITLAGTDADRRGPGRALAIGVVLFAGGMVVSGIAGSMLQVIAGRAIQGLGSGAIGSVVYAAIARAYPSSATPRMIALTSSAWVVPGLVGPALAGIVSDALGWRWVFLGIVPPVLLMGAVVYPQLARLGAAVRVSEPLRSDARRALDAVRLALGSTLLLAALTVRSLLPAVAMLAIGAWLALGGVRHLLPPGSLRLAPGRPSVVIVIFAIAFAFFGTEAFVPLTVVEIRGGSVTLGGIALSAAAVSWAAGSWFQDRAAAAGMRRTLVTIGSAMIGAGIGVTALVLLPAAPVLTAAIGWGIAGLGMGLAYSMLALLMLETSTPGEEGFSSAALQLMFTLGTAFGAGVGGAVVALAEEGRLELAPALGLVDIAMLVVAALAVLISLRVPRDGEAVRRESPIRQGAPLEHP